MLYVLLATYHEEQNIGTMLFYLVRTLQNPFFIIVDDSEDTNTQKAAYCAFEALGFSHYKYIYRGQKLGLGTAYRLAASEIEALRKEGGKLDDLIAILDADLSHDPCDISRLVKRLDELDADIVAGTRYAKGGSVAGWPFRRTVISATANFLAQTALRLGTTDCTSSMRVYKADIFSSISKQTTATGFAIQLEIIALATAAGYRIAEIPICFSERVNGASSFSTEEIYKFILLVARLWRLRCAASRLSCRQNHRLLRSQSPPVHPPSTLSQK